MVALGRSKLRFGLVAALLLASCGKPDFRDVRVYATDSVLAQKAPSDLRGTFVWPAEKELDPYEIAQLAAPLIDSNPSWGAYVGVSQSSENGGALDNCLTVDLVSIESVPRFVKFCNGLGYEKGVILIFTKDEASFSNCRLTDIVGVYKELQNYRMN
ncbi:MAG: hypothetical protein HUU46_23665 [Candidatus Hydrogenedentes bacterium]|nr:hypothetical protein [Candidatus Hydrogenedentota bacterium]